MLDAHSDPESTAYDVPPPFARSMDMQTLDSPLDFQGTGSACAVAGPHFSNPDLDGSLRPGGVVHFFSRECAGLVAATFASMFSSQALLVLVEPLYTQLGWSAMQVSALKRLIQMPLTLSVVVGLLSDSYPIRGVRRKWYVVPGSILHVVAVFTLAGISAMHPRALPPRDALVVVALCVQTRVIEYSQRE